MISLSDLQNFPKDFKFGVATSSYQIEGNNYGDCGKSIWDDFAKRKLSGIDGKNACNHIKYFIEDIKLIKEAGFKAYRFSFAWPRLFPDNDKDVNFCITRYGNVMGSRGSVIPLFINQIMRNKSLTVTDLNMSRFLMSLTDTVNLVYEALLNGKNGDIFVQKSSC